MSWTSRTDISDDGSQYDNFPQHNIDVEVASKLPKFAEIINISSNHYTVTVDDNSKILQFLAEGFGNIVLPTGLTKGYQIRVVNYGGVSANTKTIIPETGATIKSKNNEFGLSPQYGEAYVYNAGNDVWVINGDLIDVGVLTELLYDSNGEQVFDSNGEEIQILI